MKKEDAGFLLKIMQSIREAEPRLEEKYEKKDIEGFNEIKKILLGLNSKMQEILR